MQRMWPTGIALSTDDRQLIDLMAATSGVSRSEMIRRLIRGYATYTAILAESTTTKPQIVVVN